VFGAIFYLLKFDYGNLKAQLRRIKINNSVLKLAPQLDCVIPRTAGKDVGVGVEGD